MLGVAQHETGTVEYSASWDHADVRPGNSVAVADPDKAEVRTGGRVEEATASVITVDFPFIPVVATTYTLMVTLPSYSRSACVTVARWIFDLKRCRRVDTNIPPVPARTWVQAAADRKSVA